MAESAPPGGTNCTTGLRYSLTGPQIDPAAAYWMYCAKLRLINIEELSAITDNPANQGVTGRNACYFPPYKPSDHPVELAQLKVMESNRDNPAAINPTDPNAPAGLPPREPISRFWNLMPPPMGAVYANRLPNEQQIRTGRGLARAVESETPGLIHRHVLNYLIRLRPDWSPPFQALVWAGLDITISSALQAAWYYKWLSEGDPTATPPNPPMAYQNGSQWPIPRPCTSYRPRPVEFDNTLIVLFDNPDELNPDLPKCPRPGTVLSVGTPRHPAYPSGHSTYAAAASEYLRFFFGNLPTPPRLRATRARGNHAVFLRDEFDYLADNVGLGRMWGGVHWLTDHTSGRLLGRVVARLVLQQMLDMLGRMNPQGGPLPNLLRGLCMQPGVCPAPPPPPPSQADVKADAEAFRNQCQPTARPANLPTPVGSCPSVPPCPAPNLALTALPETVLRLFDEETDLIEAARSPQQGGAVSEDLYRRRDQEDRLEQE